MIQKGLKLIFIMMIVSAIIFTTWSLAEERSSKPVTEAADTGSQKEARGVTADVCRIQSLRREVGLRNEDLAAMGLSKVEAKNLFTHLCEWYEANKMQLGQADAELRAAKREVRQTSRKINIGPRDETLIARLPLLQKEVIRLQKATQVQQQALVRLVESQLDGAQRMTWQTIRANGRQSIPYRFIPDVTDEQRESLRHARVKNARRRAIGKGDTRGTASTSNALDSILFARQRNAKGEAMANLRRCMSGVLEAEEDIMFRADQSDPSDPSERN